MQKFDQKIPKLTTRDTNIEIIKLIIRDTRLVQCITITIKGPFFTNTPKIIANKLTGTSYSIQ